MIPLRRLHRRLLPHRVRAGRGRKEVRHAASPSLSRPVAHAGIPAVITVLETFAAGWQDRYPAIIKLWRAHWEEFTPFLAFPPEVRRVIYTTNLIESMNARLRKVPRNRGQFPSEQTVLKVLYLAVRNPEEFRSHNAGIRSSG